MKLTVGDPINCVSTDDQKLNLQQDALRVAGCEKIFEDYLSGAKAARPGLNAALEMTRAYAIG